MDGQIVQVLEVKASTITLQNTFGLQVQRLIVSKIQRKEVASLPRLPLNRKHSTRQQLATNENENGNFQKVKIRDCCSQFLNIASEIHQKNGPRKRSVADHALQE